MTVFIMLVMNHGNDSYSNDGNESNDNDGDDEG